MIFGFAPQSSRVFSSFSPSVKDILLLHIRLTTSKSIVYPLLFLSLILRFFEMSVLRMVYLSGLLGRFKISKIDSIDNYSSFGYGYGWLSFVPEIVGRN